MSPDVREKYKICYRFKQNHRKNTTQRRKDYRLTNDERARSLVLKRPSRQLEQIFSFLECYEKKKEKEKNNVIRKIYI